MLRNRFPFLIEFNERERATLMRVDGWYQILPIRAEAFRMFKLYQKSLDKNNTLPVVVPGLQVGLIP
jgi:hypothetical protein